MIQLALELDAPVRVQDYILAEVPVDDESRTRAPRPAPPVYHVVISSGPDFVATRTYRGKMSTLVLLVSQGQYYLRQGDNIKQLTGRRLFQWVGGNDEIDHDIRPEWSTETLLCYDRDACRGLVGLLENAVARELIKRDLLRFEPLELSRQMRYLPRVTESCEWSAVESLIRILSRFYDHATLRTAVSCACHTVYRDTSDDGWVPACSVIEEADYATHLLELIGPDNFRKILRSMDAAFGNCHAVWHVMFYCQRIVELLRIGNADASNARIADHLAAIISQYRGGPERGLGAFATFLRSQLQVRGGRITEPLPRDLNEASRRLIAEHDAQINNQYSHMAERAEALAAEGYADDTWIIRPIRTMVELKNEAEAMHNCIESYAEDYNDGRCELWVMRRKARPERSYIDIEIRRNRVRQAFRACNEHLSDAEWTVIDRWAIRRHVNLIHERNVPLAPPRR